MSDELMPEETVEEPVEAVEPVEAEVVEEPKPKRKRATKKAAEEAGVEVSEPHIGEVEDNVIKSAPKAHTDGPVRSNTQTSATGVIGSVAADKPKAAAPVKAEPEKVALWSNKNIRWGGVGALSKGYNIVIKEAADKWLTREGIREATPEEVADHYGK
jgi:hypothetical protein